MPHLALHLLGGFQALLDGELVTNFESAKIRALLAYLAVEAHRSHRRERLTGLLWPDHPEQSARRSLSRALSSLRTTIQDRDALPPFLVIRSAFIQFNSESDAWVDVQAFSAATVASPVESIDPKRLEQALALYQGGFLEGFGLKASPDFDDWALIVRERLQRQAATALQRLVAHYEGSGNYDRACEYAWRQVELERWQESAHQQLMRLLALSGKRSEALAQYEVCRRTLETELDVAPSIETTTLYEQIRRDELRLPGKARDLVPSQVPGQAPEGPTSLSSAPPLPCSPAPAPSLEGERRVVTLLRVDVQGEAALLQHADIETWAAIITPVLHLLGTEIVRLGGNVEQYRQQGLTACFGRQVAHEDDPERAVLAALVMQDAFAAYLAERDVADLCLTVGVHTGEVILTPIADTVSMMGGILDDAEHLEASLKPGTIWVSEETYKLVHPLFAWATCEDHTYRPLAHKHPINKGRGLAGLTSPLVGREVEFQTLQTAISRLQSGIGGIVTLVGEAGLGKSRLVAELHQSTNAQWLEGHCLSYGSAMAYLLWIDVVRDLLDMGPNNDPLEVRDALHQKVRALCPDAFADVYPFLVQLLSLAPDQLATERLRGIDAQGLQTLTFRALLRLMESAAQQRPLVLVCEDLHWADPTSLEVLEHLLPLTDRVPLLCICVLRPETDHGCWRIKELAARRFRHRHTDMWLSPLSPRDASTLVSNLLHIDVWPATVRQRILEMAEGNPFYVEELIRALPNGEAIVHDTTNSRWRTTADDYVLALPTTLHGVLRSRIDRLAPETRRVLQIAAVIGRVFSQRVLIKVAGEGLPLETHLLALQQAQLIHEQSRQPESMYRFEHQLTQEAAYSSLLQKRRRTLHRQAAEVLELLYPDRTEELLGLLAHHWERAGEMQKAVDYLRRAGEQAASQYANVEAVNYLSRALKLTPESDIAERYALLSARAGVSYLQGQYAAQAQDLAELVRLATALDEREPWPGRSRQAEVLIQRARHADRGYQLAEARSLAQEAVHLAQAAQDIASEASGYREWGNALWLQSSHTESLAQLERALTLSQKARLPRIQVATLHSLGSLYLDSICDPARAQFYFEQALRICQETGNRRDESEAQRDLGSALQAQGKLGLAVPYLERSRQLSRATGDRRNEGRALLLLGEIAFEQGHSVEGEACCEQALEILREINAPLGIERTLQALITGALDQGQPGKVLTYLERALWDSRQEGDSIAERQRLAGIGGFLLGQGNYSEALEYFQQALDISRETGDRNGEAASLRGFGRFYFCQGAYDRARAFMEQSLPIARDSELSRDKRSCLVMLGLIAHDRGDDEVAHQYGLQILHDAQGEGQFPDQGMAWRILGDAEAGLCHWDEAAQAYTNSLELLRKADIYYFKRWVFRSRITESQAGLARVALAQGNPALALTHVQTVLCALKDRPVLYYAVEPLAIYLTCYQVLQANADPRAQEILSTAYAILQTRATNIGEEELRYSYLENVPHHRRIVAEIESSNAHKQERPTTL